MPASVSFRFVSFRFHQRFSFAVYQTARKLLLLTHLIGKNTDDRHGHLFFINFVVIIINANLYGVDVVYTKSIL